MKEIDPYLGQVLDSKYRLERLLGRGGMGSVYLATHLGTEQFGGESVSDALAQIEDVRDVNSVWRQRMRTRLSLHTPRSTSKPGSGSGKRRQSARAVVRSSRQEQEQSSARHSAIAPCNS